MKIFDIKHNKGLFSILVLFTLLLVFFIILSTGLVQEPLAKFTASNYTSATYPNRDFHIVSISYETLFWEYVVVVRDEDGYELTVWIGPAFFPVTVSRDNGWHGAAVLP